MTLLAVALAAASVALGAAQVDAWVSGVCRAHRSTIVAAGVGLALAALVYVAVGGNVSVIAAPVALCAFAAAYVAGAARLAQAAR